MSMRIAEVMEATTGGTRRHLLDIVEHIDRTRFDVAVICAATRDASFADDVARMRATGTHVVVVPSLVREIDPRKDLSAFKAICAELCKGGYDVVHTHCAKAGFLGRLAARRAGVSAIVHTPHVFPFRMDVGAVKQRGYFMLERMCAARTDRMICVYAGQEQDALRLVSSSRVEVIVNGMDAGPAMTEADRVGARSKLGLADDATVVGTVGRCSAQKGHRYFVGAAHEIGKRHPNAVFLLVGDGELVAETRALVKKEGIEDRFVFVDDEETAGRLYMPAMDVFVLPSLWEGLPYALLEAMAAGVPVVAADVGGVGEVVVQGETGVLIAPRDASALAREVCELLGDPVRCNSLAAAGRERVLREFQLSEMVGKLQKLYKNVVEAREERGL